MPLDPKASSVRSELFGGQGTVTTWSRLPHGATPFSAAIWCELSPGGHVGAHRQQRDPEIVLTIEGEGEIQVGQSVHQVSRGDLVYVPQGEVLQIANTSEQHPFVYAIIKAVNPSG